MADESSLRDIKEIDYVIDQGKAAWSGSAKGPWSGRLPQKCLIDILSLLYAEITSTLNNLEITY